MKPLATPARRTSGCSDITLFSCGESGWALVRGGGFSGARALASSRNFTLTAMSGRMRGSFCLKPMRTLTVAFSRLAVGTMAITEAGMVQSG